uniref:Uncharacterized protein n=1 Tax=Rhizophora mucronata TaxID=61149 RepID=A0A2P2QSC8_RHIMU
MALGKFYAMQYFVQLKAQKTFMPSRKENVKGLRICLHVMSDILAHYSHIGNARNIELPSSVLFTFLFRVVGGSRYRQISLQI